MPQLIMALPDLKYIQVVRDGRDMAWSSNQNQLLKHGAAVLGDQLKSSPLESRSIALWQWANIRAAETLRRAPDANHLVVFYENLCDRPLIEFQRIATFIGANHTDIKSFNINVTQSKRSGTWRSKLLLKEVSNTGKKGLQYFNYI